MDGQGNFGSVDGDPPAAMRYTEARLAPPALDLLADIGKNTVDFTDNFDGTLTEPTVLPSAIPNLLVNGATGIAVGMATNIPPHNLGEIVDACVYMLEKWEKLDDVNVDDLMEFVEGPDFPTGGIIIEQKGEEGIEAAYGKGRGRVTIQANAHIEEMERGKSRIIVTELPYQVNKSSLIERIAELVRDGQLEGITDLRDESDRQGLRIVIELTKNVEPEKVLAALYKRTPMQSTFSINLLALVDNEPRLLNLKQALRVYLDHRLAVIKRRTEFDLKKARARAHILEGLMVALKHLDEIIALIKASPDVEICPHAFDETLQVVGTAGQCHPGNAVAPPGCAGTQEDRDRIQGNAGPDQGTGRLAEISQKDARQWQPKSYSRLRQPTVTGAGPRLSA